MQASKLLTSFLSREIKIKSDYGSSISKLWKGMMNQQLLSNKQKSRFVWHFKLKISLQTNKQAAVTYYLPACLLACCIGK